MSGPTKSWLIGQFFPQPVRIPSQTEIQTRNICAREIVACDRRHLSLGLIDDPQASAWKARVVERQTEARPPMNNVNPECASCKLGCVSKGECPFHEVKMKEGEFLLHQGEKPRSVWYIKEGQVAVSSVDASGEETSCAVRTKGALLGIEALTESQSAYQARALTPVVACELASDALDEWVGFRDTPMGAVLELAIGEAQQRVVERRGLAGSAVSRLARFLLERLEKEENRVRMPQQVLANVLGMRPETLSRAIGKLRTAGAIAPGRGLVVLDAKQLGEFSNEAEGESATA